MIRIIAWNLQDKFETNRSQLELLLRCDYRIHTSQKEPSTKKEKYLESQLRYIEVAMHWSWHTTSALHEILFGGYQTACTCSGLTFSIVKALICSWMWLISVNNHLDALVGLPVWPITRAQGGLSPSSSSTSSTEAWRSWKLPSHDASRLW